MSDPQPAASSPELSPLDIPGLLRSRGLRPDKRLGQNFLSDDTILARVAGAADPSPQDEVLEIGPGLGSLTRHLALRSRRVVAVELDPDLVKILREVLAPFPNIDIFQGDILGYDPLKLKLPPGYLVAANIPFYITSAILRHLLEQPIRPGRIVLTVQREVAQRITAAPGDLSLLALSVQVYGQPQVVGRIPAGAFYPPPKVDSSIIRVDLYPQPVIPTASLNDFFRLAKAGFSQKRKTLRNTLSAVLRVEPAQAAELLLRAGIDPQRRAETVSLEEWGRLVEEYQKNEE